MEKCPKLKHPKRFDLWISSVDMMCKTVEKLIESTFDSVPCGNIGVINRLVHIVLWIQLRAHWQRTWVVSGASSWRRLALNSTLWW